MLRSRGWRDVTLVAADALNRQDFGRAKGIVAEVLRHLPQHPDALHLAGYIKLAEGEEDEAVRLMSRTSSRSCSMAKFTASAMAPVMSSETVARAVRSPSARLSTRSRLRRVGC